MFNRFKSSGTCKLIAASAMLAFGSITAAGTATAGEAGQGRDTPRSANYYAKKDHFAAQRRKKAKNHVSHKRRKARNNVRHREDRRVRRQVKRAIGRIASGILNEPRVVYRDYGPRRGFRGRRFNDFCVAVARTRGGYGRRLGIRAEGYGRRACRKAMRRCNRRLDFRQSTGRNPYAACVIARRG